MFKEAEKIISGCIFKYGDIENLDRTLKKLTLGFKPLNGFNDIYENEYHITHYFNNIEEQKSLHAISPYGKIHDLIKAHLNKVKVTCFTSNATNNLMWSHYAEEHKGLCYCFDKSTIFQNQNMGWGNIKYSTRMPNISIFQNQTTEGMLEAQLDEIILTKSIEWAYEDEQRFYKIMEKNYLNFDPMSLKAIIIGRRVKSSKIKQITSCIKIFNQKNSTNLKVLFAARHASSYKLSITTDENFRDNCENNFNVSITNRTSFVVDDKSD